MGHNSTVELGIGQKKTVNRLVFNRYFGQISDFVAGVQLYSKATTMPSTSSTSWSAV